MLLCPMPGLRVEIGRNNTAWQGKRKYQVASQERPKGGERNIKIKLSHENIQNSGGKEKKKKDLQIRARLQGTRNFNMFLLFIALSN